MIHGISANYFVEIDIVMDGDMPLWRAHDIAQDLQDQVEKLPDVDRCFVHIDHETDHKPVSNRVDLILVVQGTDIDLYAQNRNIADTCDPRKVLATSSLLAEGVMLV
jgi:hypothetical protein